MKKKNKTDKYLLLSSKKVLGILGVWILAVLLHNLIYGIFKPWFDARGGDEPFFFIIAVIVIPLYFVISFIYTIVKMIMNRTLGMNHIFRFIVSVIMATLISHFIIFLGVFNLDGFLMMTIVFTIIVYPIVDIVAKKMR